MEERPKVPKIIVNGEKEVYKIQHKFKMFITYIPKDKVVYIEFSMGFIVISLVNGERLKFDKSEIEITECNKIEKLEL